MEETLILIDFVDMEAKLKSILSSLVSVKEMGAYKALISFSSTEPMKDALENKSNILKEHFEDLKIWSKEDLCQTYRVWVECFDIPPHAWSISTTKKICDYWGTFVKVDKGTKNGEEFSSTRCLMDTCYYQHIYGSMYLSVEGTGYDVFVKEFEFGRCSYYSGVEIKGHKLKIQS